MMLGEYDWIIGVCCTECDGVSIYKFRGTIQETKEKILSMIKEDIECDKENYAHGSENITDIHAVDNGLGYELYGYGCYENYHIDYTAKEVSHIENI